jgi:site-specific DNA-methyltransferase (adenine-specific)
MKVYNIKINGENYEVVKDTDGFFIKPDFLVSGGTAMKPANEPICVARKPLSEKSVAENVLKWRTGGINVDGTRISHDEPIRHMKAQEGGDKVYSQAGRKVDTTELKEEGRFPANIIFECICDEVIKGEKVEVKSNTREAGNSFNNYDDKVGKVVTRIENYGDKGDIHTNPDCPCRILDKHSGYLKSGAVKPHHKKNKTANGYQGSCYGKFQNEDTTLKGYGDGGGASRFFYQAKVSKAERNMGLDGFDDKETNATNQNWRCVNCNKFQLSGNGDICKCDEPEWKAPINKNTHPTLKPVSLMSYLVRMVTPANGIVLDPFMGSGSTGIAAQLEGFRFVGMEMDENYFKIAEARINNFEKYKKFIK